MNTYEKLLEIAAPSLLPVLLLGESGCGKEVAAHSLHSQSSRGQGPFIAVNCGALAPSLLESLLCGHLRGAFTGADREQLGFVRAASGGTLFLDEVGELPLAAQSRLLRILQEKCVTPLGAQKEIPVDFRLICATHRDLGELMHSGAFRQDLYFRIAVFPIALPPLRERLEDLPILAQSLWKNANGPDTPSLSPAEIALLGVQTWPGNIRQMRNVLERYALLRAHGVPLAQILSTEIQAPAQPYQTNAQPPSATPTRARSPGWHRIAESLHASGHNKTQAARVLGISRGSLCYQLKKHEHGVSHA